MKQSSVKIRLIVLMSLVSSMSFAHDIEVKNADGVTIYYDWYENETELEVTYYGDDSDSYDNKYSGEVVIPSQVTYNGKTYKVTRIGCGAFSDCDGLTSITLSNSITTIDDDAFSGCGGLTSIAIPNSVTYIGSGAFYDCI